METLRQHAIEWARAGLLPATLTEQEPLMTDAAVMQQLCPTGKLRIAVAVAPSPSAQFAIKVGDEIRGVAIILGRALAKKLGVEADVIAHSSSGEIQNSSADNKWDVAFLPVDAERKKFVDFGNAYHLLQSTFLVAPGSAMQSVKDADAAGIGIGGVANTATFRAAMTSTPKATHIEFKGVDLATQAMLEGRIQAIALSRESLGGLAAKVPGSRVLDDAFLNSTTSVCIPKGKPAALAYVTEFIEGAKASGLVRQAFDEMGLASSIVAPAGMAS
jgi:polar amino acid transport system substrate-binding protein